MSFSNIDSLRLGKAVHILFSKTLLSQVTEDVREWEQIASRKVGDQAARSMRFMLQKSHGPAAAAAARNPGTSGRTFPQAQQSSVEEFEALFKEYNTTIKLELQMWERAMMAKNAKYFEPLALETQSKAIAQKRLMTGEFYMDGTGVRGTVASVTETDIAEGRLVVTLNATSGTRGHVGLFEYDDIFVIYQSGGSARSASVSSGSQPYGWKVVDKDFAANTVTFDAVDSSETVMTTVTATNGAAGDVLYRVSQPTKGNLGSVTDYATVTETITGLESLAATDGRTVHGITMSGVYRSSMYDADAATLDVDLFDRALFTGKRRVGQGRYRYKKACMADETHNLLIDSRETDRRFLQVTDNKRGTTYFAYQHRNDLVEAYTTEFCPKTRIWMLPEDSGGNKVIEYHGSDWKGVKVPGGGEFHLNPASGGGHTNDMVSYSRALGVLICKHPAAIVGLKNFALS